MELSRISNNGWQIFLKFDRYNYSFWKCYTEKSNEFVNEALIFVDLNNVSVFRANVNRCFTRDAPVTMPL